ncbi:hypothetical protein ABMZ65_01660 [Morganella morganii]|uniref:hypothetical protein n=1 Tax=Morganella morganii TaxID=582 RepID=UPI000B3FB35B|nr:hypothetical protein [Morganella morganii]EKL3980341.1 hypothetical protein [Morganella morganii]EKU4289297.1 hypothetical protein [Morganella morganii]EKU4304853.1 hypothetical protein [Morganella morganii]EKU6425242.1 hypothetical protein [Morganella morganii]ELB1983202.1 hypothetical protein [Morganella morganii]
MAGNTFDFELNADDQASQEIANIEAELNKLRPVLKDVRESLKMGGDESISGLRDVGERIRDMSDFSKKGAQSIGDMIPPLKNFGELSGKYLNMAKKIGGIGAIGYAGYQMISQVPEQARKATEVSTSAKNMGMSVEEGTRLTGTLIQKGSTEDDARQSFESLYGSLNDAVRGNNNELLATIRSIGASIIQREDGSVDLTKTLLSLEKAIQNIPESRNTELQSKLGLSPEVLALLREGNLQERLDKSDRMGHTRDDAVVEQLSKMDEVLKNISAAYEGAKTKTGDAVAGALLSDGSVIDGLNGVEQLLTYGPDNVALMQTMGFLHGNDSDILRTTYNTPELYGKLGMWDQSMVDFGIMTDEIRKNYEEWEKQRHQAETAKQKSALNSKVPDNWVQDETYNPNRRGLRNNNPGNLIAAPNSVGYDYGNNHRYVKFASSRDGNAALSRQIMLDAERGLNTLDSLLRKYAPASVGNNTQGYIDRVSKGTGFNPYERLDMHDPRVLEKIIPYIIKVENIEQPYSYEEISAGITDSIMDDRWAGGRNPYRVQEQRNAFMMQQETESVVPDFKIEKDPTQALLAFTEQLSQVLQENKAGGTLEIVLTNAETGTKSSVNVKPKGRVTTAMNMP